MSCLHCHTANNGADNNFLNDTLAAFGRGGIFSPKQRLLKHITAVFLLKWFISIYIPQPEKTFAETFGSQTNVCITTTFERFLFENIRMFVSKTFSIEV